MCQNDTKLADYLCNKPKIVQLYHAAIFYSFFYEVIFYFLIGNNQSSILLRDFQYFQIFHNVALDYECESK